MIPDLWRYVTLGATAFVGSELVPLLAGFAAEEGLLRWPLVVASCAAGAWIVSCALYFVGRTHAHWVSRKLEHVAPIVRKVLGNMGSNPWRSTILARFVFGGRILLPLACGVQ